MSIRRMRIPAALVALALLAFFFGTRVAHRASGTGEASDDRVLAEVIRFVQDAYVDPVDVSRLYVAATAAVVRWLEEENPDFAPPPGWEEASGAEKDARDILREIVELAAAPSGEDPDSLTRAPSRDLLYRVAIQAAMAELSDPNSQYMPPEVWEEMQIRTQGEYGGVGLEVVDQDGFVTVVAPIPGGPSARAGIRRGDRIVEVDGVSIRGKRTDDAVDLLRGKPGDPVEMGIERFGSESVLPFEVVRALISVPSVPFALMAEEGIGYIPLQTFNASAAAEAQSAIDSLTDLGMRALVLDLRDNRGGLLEAGRLITDLFLDPNLDIVDIRGRAPGHSQRLISHRKQKYPDLALAVLVGGGSASASEILAGALQEHDRALVIGMPTFGKGSVQTLMPLGSGNKRSVLKLTTAKWYTPVGRSIEKPHAAKMQARHEPTVQGFPQEILGEEDRPVFRSTSGRVLYGGGGIVPDIVVEQPLLATVETEAVRAILDGGAGFFAAIQDWAAAYARRHEDLDPEFQVGEEDVSDLMKGLADRGADIDPERFAEASRYVRYQMAREVALLKWSEAGRFSWGAGMDTQYQEALALLRDARDQADLLARADASPARR